MPFILQDGRLVEVTDAQFAAFGGGEAQLRRTTAAERRARAAAEAAGGQDIQTTSQTDPAANQQIINPNTTNNTPGQTLEKVAAPLQDEGTTNTQITEAPPIPGLERPRGFQTDQVSFTREELNAAGITNVPDNAPILPSEDNPAPINTSFVVATPQGTLIFPDDQTYQAWQANPQSVAFSTGPGGQYVSVVERVEEFEAADIPAGEDPYVDLQDEGDNITQFEGIIDQPEPEPVDSPYVDTEGTEQFEGTIEQVEPEPVDSPYEDNNELIEFERADPDVFEPEGVDPEEDPYAQLVEDTEAEGGAVEFTADGPVGRNSEELNQIAAAAKATLANARAQAALKAQRKQADDGDWRVKLRLAPGSDYLYRASDGSGGQAGILQPLVNTDGVIFPYTPTIQTNYKANYNSYDLTHSNYRGYFYQGSSVDEVNLTATFTAQDTYEAEYLLAVIHFFRSITKMFYGKDTNAGTPPPLVFLQGLGEYQFNLHPCVVSSFTYNLPNDVDYIRARSPNQANLPAGLLQARQRQTVATNPFSAAWQRLQAAGVPKGGVNRTPAPPALGTKSPTYVPTKIDIQIVLLPVQSRSQVTNNFSLQKYANGDLIKGGFW